MHHQVSKVVLVLKCRDG